MKETGRRSAPFTARGCGLRQAVLATIDPADLQAFKKLGKDKLLRLKSRVDKKYGEGVTDMLIGG